MELQTLRAGCWQHRAIVMSEASALPSPKEDLDCGYPSDSLGHLEKQNKIRSTAPASGPEILIELG